MDEDPQILEVSLHRIRISVDAHHELVCELAAAILKLRAQTASAVHGRDLALVDIGEVERFVAGSKLNPRR